MRFSLIDPLIKYAATGVAAILLIIITVTPLMTTIVEGWSRRDVELRSRLAFRSIEDRVTNAISVAGSSELTSYFEHLAEDEKLIALGFCDELGKLTNATMLLPKTLKCEDLPQGAGESSSRRCVPISGRYLVSVFPITAGEKKGHVVLLHDLNFVDDRAREARLYLTLALIGVAVGLSLLATAVVLGLLRGWRRSIKAQIEDFGLPSAVPRGDDSGFDREIQSLLSELNVERRYAEGIKVEWSPATLRTLLEEELPGTQVIVVSNREPYIHERTNGSDRLQRPASGLVDRARAGDARLLRHLDRARQRLGRPRHRRSPRPRRGAARRARLYCCAASGSREEEEEGYYYGFANEGLWPLCHIAHVRPDLPRERLGALCRASTERFADAVVDGGDAATTRSCSCRTTTSRCCRA